MHSQEVSISSLNNVLFRIVAKQTAQFSEIGTGGYRGVGVLLLRTGLFRSLRGEPVEDVLGGIVAKPYDGLREAEGDNAHKNF